MTRPTELPTRERLVRAARELLHSGGQAAVTTVGVTRAAGVVQSAFYKHFGSVGECLAEAVVRVASELREAIAAARQRMYDSGPGAGEDLERFFLDTFEMLARHRAVTELFLRHRSDPLALGGVMARLAQNLRADLARQLTEQAARAGLTGVPADWVDALAGGLIGAGLAAVEAHLSGAGLPAAASARLLAAFSEAAGLGVLRALPPV